MNSTGWMRPMGHAVQLTGQRPTRWRSTVCHNATPNLNSCPHSVVPCSHTCGRNGNARRVRLGDAVELEYYRLQQVSSGAIQLGDDDDPQVAGPSAVGTGRPEEPTAPLSEIIQRLNERFGTRFAEADRLFFEQLARASAQVDEIQRTAKANTFEKFYLGTRERVIKVIINRMAENDEIAARCLNDPDFAQVVLPGLLRRIYDMIWAQEPAAPPRT